MTLNMIALIKLRVINSGERADGGKFSKYSEALVPYWYFGSSLKNPDFNVKAKQKELLAKVGYFASYKDWRQINHRPTDMKNFSFTNALWASIVPVVVFETDGITDVEIRSNDTLYNDTVIPALSRREGINILEANPYELILLRDAELARLEKILKSNNVI